MALLGYAKWLSIYRLYEPLQVDNGVFSPLKAQDLAPFVFTLAISWRSGRDRLAFVKLSDLHV